MQKVQYRWNVDESVGDVLRVCNVRVTFYIFCLSFSSSCSNQTRFGETLKMDIQGKQKTLVYIHLSKDKHRVYAKRNGVYQEKSHLYGGETNLYTKTTQTFTPRNITPSHIKYTFT